MPHDPPHTDAARAAATLAREVSPPWLYDHLWRTWHFGAELVERRGILAMDTEVAFVAAMLHDLGLTDRYDGPQPFEDNGVVGATEFARGRGWSADRIATMAIAIARHMDLDAADEIPEVALVHLGAAADVVGLRLEQIPDELIDQVLTEYPRQGFSHQLRLVFDRQVEAKPDSKVAHLYADVGFRELIGTAPLDHRSPPPPTRGS